MPLSDDEKRRFREIDTRCTEAGKEGVFVDKGGLSCQEMAMLMWQQGYLAVPTTECLFDEIEKSLQRTPDKK